MHTPAAARLVESDCRVVFNEITKEAILESFKHPRAINMDLVDAQQARRALDRLVGYNISPILWKKVKKGLSAGRVQSVSLRLIIDRENEIKKFEPEEYWSIDASFEKGKKQFDAFYYGDGKEKIKLTNEDQVKIGVNIQKGQYLLINTSTDTLDFTRIVVKKAYEAGASRVHVNLTDASFERDYYENVSIEETANFPKWTVAQREELIERKGAQLWIDAENPDLLAGINVDIISAQQKAAGAALVNYRKAVMNDDIAWSIIAVPSPKWAAKVFPNLTEEEQVPALWDAIFKTVRIGEGNAVTKWLTHIENLHARADQLNAKKYAKLHYKAPGTDLTIELPEKHLWKSGSSKSPDGTTFIANMPTEEVFTLPSKYGING